MADQMRKYVFHGYGKHDSPQHKTYRVWQLMIQRCHNPNNDHYHRYGGRGISVCESWRVSFLAFLADMGDRPDGKTLDRFPNNSGNYEKTNCRWATLAEQARNTRRNIKFDGICVLDHSKALGSKRGLVNSRLRRGWTLEKAVSTRKLTPSEAGKLGNDVRNGRS